MCNEWPLALCDRGRTLLSGRSASDAGAFVKTLLRRVSARDRAPCWASADGADSGSLALGLAGKTDRDRATRVFVFLGVIMLAKDWFRSQSHFMRFGTTASPGSQSSLSGPDYVCARQAACGAR